MGKMPSNKCSYFKCQNTSDRKSMFRFPWNDPSRLKVWVQHCGNMKMSHLSAVSLRSRYICIDHFNPKYVRNHAGVRKRIQRVAIPEPYNGIKNLGNFRDPPSGSPDLKLPGASEPSVKKTSFESEKTAKVPTECVCNSCEGEIFGFRYTCVQCVSYNLCMHCEALREHADHYMLRIPSGKCNTETERVLDRIRADLNIIEQPKDVPKDNEESCIEMESLEIKQEPLANQTEDTDIAMVPDCPPSPRLTEPKNETERVLDRISADLNIMEQPKDVPKDNEESCTEIEAPDIKQEPLPLSHQTEDTDTAMVPDCVPSPRLTTPKVLNEAERVLDRINAYWKIMEQPKDVPKDNEESCIEMEALQIKQEPLPYSHQTEDTDTSMVPDCVPSPRLTTPKVLRTYARTVRKKKQDSKGDNTEFQPKATKTSLTVVDERVADTAYRDNTKIKLEIKDEPIDLEHDRSSAASSVTIAPSSLFLQDVPIFEGVELAIKGG